MIKLVLLFLMIVACGCSPQKSNEIPAEFQELKNLTVYSEHTKIRETISFKKEVIYGESKKDLIGRMGDMTVDSLGRVFIADIQVQVIYIFEPNGRYLTQLGREGRGPGEFGYIKSLQIRNNLLYVYDFKQQKVGVFTLDTLAGYKTIELARNRGKYKALQRAYPSIHKIYIRNNRTYLAEFISDSSREHQIWQNVEMKGLFYLLEDNGLIASKLFEFPSETRTQLEVFLYPVKDFFGDALTVLSSDNSIYWASPGHFLIKVYSSNGTYQHAFYYPHKKVPLTQESAIEARVPDLYIKDMNSMDLPETWPVLTGMKIDDQDRLWIATTIEKMNVYEWWVLKNTGEVITKFEWPRDKPIEEVRNGKLYTRETDEETGLQKIVRYDIELTRD